MNNRILLSLVLLFSIPAIARLSHEEANQRLAIAQNRIDELTKQMHTLDAKNQATLKSMQEVSGNEEFAQAIRQRDELLKARIAEREQIRSQLDQAFSERQKLVSEVGTKFPISSDGQGKYVVGRREAPLPASESMKYQATRTTAFAR